MEDNQHRHLTKSVIHSLCKCVLYIYIYIYGGLTVAIVYVRVSINTDTTRKTVDLCPEFLDNETFRDVEYNLQIWINLGFYFSLSTNENGHWSNYKSVNFCTSKCFRVSVVRRPQHKYDKIIYTIPYWLYT